MAKRVGRIVTKTLKKLKQMGQKDITADDLMAEMADIQLELCRKYLALKSSGTISIVAGTDHYTIDPSIYRIRQIIPPEEWSLKFVITNDSDEWAKAKTATYYDSTQPQAGFIWNGTLFVAPNPTEDADLDYYSYNVPSADLSYSGDPETPVEWDICYENELAWRFGNDKNAHILYERRAAELGQESFTTTGIIRVASTTDELNF